MSHPSTSILVGVASPLSEILLFSKMAKFSFRTMGYSPWSSKNLIDRNQPKNFMLVGIDVTCMYIDFGGHSLSSFGNIATFKNGQISLSDHGLMVIKNSWSSKNSIDQNWPKKFMLVGIDVTCMYINFGGHSLSAFKDIATFKNGQISLSDHGL